MDNYKKVSENKMGSCQASFIFIDTKVIYNKICVHCLHIFKLLLQFGEHARFFKVSFYKFSTYVPS